MKKLIGIGLLLAWTSAQGATVQTATCPVNTGLTCATGITGLVVASTTYDVGFDNDSFDNLNLGGTFPFLGDESGAISARDAIDTALNGTSATRIAFGAVEAAVFVIPFNTDVDNVRGFWDGSAWAAVVGQNDGNSAANNWHATFTVVPIPAALWLFGSGLGMLGWIRRRQTA